MRKISGWKKEGEAPPGVRKISGWKKEGEAPPGVRKIRWMEEGRTATVSELYCRKNCWELTDWF